MNSEQRINKWISELINIFPNINISYAFDDIIESHIIEVSPEYIETSSDYSDLYLDFLDSFSVDFPNEMILISTPSKYHNMSNLKFNYYGSNTFKIESFENQYKVVNVFLNHISTIYPIAV